MLKPIRDKSLPVLSSLKQLRSHFATSPELYAETKAFLSSIAGTIGSIRLDPALEIGFNVGVKGLLTIAKPRVREVKENKPSLGAIDGEAGDVDEEEAEALGRRLAARR